MDPRHLPIDQRFTGFCVFCGDEPGTQDHVPSKIFIDDPTPKNLPTVEACLKCNNGFSLDEEYFGCFLESVICGTVDVEKVSREKIRKIYNRKPDLAARILSSQSIDLFGQIAWEPEEERIGRIVTKLARGHVAYELSLPQMDEPDTVSFFPLPLLNEKQRDAFENISYAELAIWPEFGSRAFHRILGVEPFGNEPGPWIVVQGGRYRYSVIQDGGVKVRIVLSEYLACEIIWD